jgi:hypothetical protein
MGSISPLSAQDPPPYTYSRLSPDEAPRPSTQVGGKTILVPHPAESVQSSSRMAAIPVNDTHLRVLDSHDPLSTCDARFADLILTHMILPRLRVGVLRWKDRESLEYVPQTKEDVIVNRPHI